VDQGRRLGRGSGRRSAGRPADIGECHVLKLTLLAADIVERAWTGGSRQILACRR
jgi:hypothetical protein